MAFKRNRNLKELVGSNCLENGKVKSAKNTFNIGKCSPCLSKTGYVCCCQLTSTTFFSQQTKIKFKIYHQGNCKSEYIIYLIDCTLYNKQYLEKAETVFSIRLNNHRKDNKGRQTETETDRETERETERGKHVFQKWIIK